METTNHTITVFKKQTVDTFDFTIGIDIYLIKVQYGKKQGWMTAWCESGKEVKELMRQDRERRLQYLKDWHGREFKEWNYENFDFYFPAHATELRAKKHFKLMVESAPKTKFINQ